MLISPQSDTCHDHTLITVLILESDPRLRASLNLYLSLEPDLRVVGATGDSSVALELARQARPQVALLAADLAGLDGLVLAGLLRLGHAGIRVVLLAIGDEQRLRLAAPACDVTYLSLYDSPRALLAAIRGCATAQGDRAGTLAWCNE